MIVKYHKLALTAALMLAITFTLSCGDNSLDDLLNDSSSSGTPARSSSSGSLVVSSSSSLARSSSGTSSSGTVQSSSSPLSSSGKNAIVYGKTITDARDGQTYETVVIGTQTWMAKNLNFQAEGAKCYFEGTRLVSADSIAKNCEIYGRLYSWETAMSACPAGWHLPYYAEWKQLLDYVGTDYRTKLMAANSVNGTGTDDYGFAALPGGHYDNSFSFIYSLHYFWTATERTVKSGDIYYSMGLGASDKRDLLSVRCVQGHPSGCTSADNNDTQYCLGESGTMKNYGSMTDKGGKTYKTVVIGEQTWMAENLDYEVEFSKCYDNKPENCEKYGRLYDWLAATEVCPAGWHLPSKEEWDTLRKVTGGDLKARGRGDAVDRYGFSALGGGSTNGNWWSATESSANNAYYFDDGIDGILYTPNTAKTIFKSVRCLKD